MLEVLFQKHFASIYIVRIDMLNDDGTHRIFELGHIHDFVSDI